MKRAGVAAWLLAAVGMALCLAGCGARGSSGPSSGLSDVSYEDAEQYTPGAAELTETVERIDIHWLVGSVTVKPHGGDTVSFSEASAGELTGDARLRYRLDGATLHIQFCQAGKWPLDEMEKDLTVLVPEGLALAEVAVKSLSAEVRLEGVQAERLTVDTTSGDMRLTGCAVTELVSTGTVSGALAAEFAQPLKAFSGDSTSGSFQISAPAIESFSAGSVSGPVRLSAQSAPKTLDIQTTSGSIDLVLPADASFTLDYGATSGELSSDLPCAMESGRYLFGDGTGAYVIGTVSGDVTLSGQGATRLPAAQ